MLSKALQAAAGNAGAGAYIEDVFSTYLYTGNGSTQTITNGIDLAGEGGLVWIKARSGETAQSHALFDTQRGVSARIQSDTTSAQYYQAGAYLTSFNSDGFAVAAQASTAGDNYTYASWTFRKAEKFFDVVTWTGDGTSSRAISHNLGAAPGVIFTKATSTTSGWNGYHRSLGATQAISLNSTNAAYTSSTAWANTAPTSSVFYVGNNTNANSNGVSYVAYLFAHDAGGFGADGTENVISCGSFTNTGSPISISLGYEPQWLLYKEASRAGDWKLIDNMRGFQVDRSGATVALYPNLSSAESAWGLVGPTATGFTFYNGGSGDTYIYIAIRRGPMKVPTLGTTVLNTITRSGNSTATTVTGVGFAPDLVFEAARTNSGGNNWVWFDRLRGNAAGLSSDNTGAEFTNSAVIQSDSLSTTMDGFRIQTANPINASGNTYVYYSFKRAPGFFDVVCWTGTGSNLTLPHNLTVTPELIIAKVRSTGSSWGVSTSTDWTKYLLLNSTNAQASASLFGTPDATNFYPTASGGFSGSGNTYVAYLFATVAGVSKVGSYTGTGTTKQINCGFSGGARFVMIKRTDSTGDWYVWDTARGIVAGNDPYLLLNSTAAEVTSTDYIDPYSAGFEISSTAPVAINASGGTFIYLAIA